MTRQKPSTRIPVRNFNGRFDAAGRGAGESRRPECARSLQSDTYCDLVVSRSRQKPLRRKNCLGSRGGSEGSTIIARCRDKRPSAAQGMGQQNEAGGNLFRIPKCLNEGQSLLKALPENQPEARGATREPQCRFGPGAAFGNWED